MNSSSTQPQKPEIKYTYEFRFIPRLPTKIAWDTKEFNDFSDPKMLFRAMRSNEYKNETPYSGQIIFKKGFFSERINPKTLDKYGKPKKPYNNPRWWEEGRSSCVKGCCRTVPPGCVIANPPPPKIDPPPPYKPPFQDYENAKDLEAQFKEIINKSSINTITISDKGWFHVYATPI